MSQPLLRVAETFLSIQGESTMTGNLCFFIRLSGCNLNCSYCDTKFAQDQAYGSDMAVEALVGLAVESGATIVEITGGEPLEQPGCGRLCRELLTQDLLVMLETNGSRTISDIPEGVKRILDWKLPSSGEVGSFLTDNLKYLTAYDEIKLVIQNEDDYIFARRLESTELAGVPAKLLYSAAWNTIELETLADWLIRDRSRGILQLQLHKYIWGPERQGV